MSLGGPAECDHVGCGAVRRSVNHWFVVSRNSSGVHISEWEKAQDMAMEEGKHFCGVAHTIAYVSKLLTPDETKVDRESTLELKPPLTREGAVPETEKREEHNAE